MISVMHLPQHNEGNAGETVSKPMKTESKNDIIQASQERKWCKEDGIYNRVGAQSNDIISGKFR